MVPLDVRSDALEPTEPRLRGVLQGLLQPAAVVRDLLEVQDLPGAAVGAGIRDQADTRPKTLQTSKLRFVWLAMMGSTLGARERIDGDRAARLHVGP